MRSSLSSSNWIELASESLAPLRERERGEQKEREREGRKRGRKRGRGW